MKNVQCAMHSKLTLFLLMTHQISEKSSLKRNVGGNYYIMVVVHIYIFIQFELLGWQQFFFTPTRIKIHSHIVKSPVDIDFHMDNIILYICIIDFHCTCTSINGAHIAYVFTFIFFTMVIF